MPGPGGRKWMGGSFFETKGMQSPGTLAGGSISTTGPRDGACIVDAATKGCPSRVVAVAARVVAQRTQNINRPVVVFQSRGTGKDNGQSSSPEQPSSFLYKVSLRKGRGC